MTLVLSRYATKVYPDAKVDEHIAIVTLKRHFFFFNLQSWNYCTVNTPSLKIKTQRIEYPSHQ
jgi:hypothetical protein